MSCYNDEELTAADVFGNADPLDALAVLVTSPTPEELEAALRTLRARLAGTDPLRVQCVRSAAIERLNALGVRAPAAAVAAALDGLGKEPGSVAGKLTDPEPWDEPVDGEGLLDEARQLFERHLVLPPYTSLMLALWTLHTYTFDYGDVTPRLGIVSPERRCGKTTLMRLLGLMCSKAIPASNISSAAVFRSIEKWRPTLLVDEADTFLPQNDELRGVLNAGQTRELAQVLRCDGETNEPKVFSTWAPVAIACIGSLPSTLEDRAIEVKMRRKAPRERVARLRDRDVRNDALEWRRRAVRWAKDSESALRGADPALPEGLDDRARDNWEPLLAVADLAGGKWPATARKAAEALSLDRSDAEGSRGVELLRDLREVFGDRDKMATEEILRALVALPERPWRAYGRSGKELNARQLGGLLKPYEVKAQKTKVNGVDWRGYLAEHLMDPFSRYLPVPSAAAPLNGNSRDEPAAEPSAAAYGPAADSSYENRGSGAAADETPGVEEKEPAPAPVPVPVPVREPGDEEPEEDDPDHEEWR